MVNARDVFAVILAGVAGTLTNTLALAIVLGADRWSLALVAGRYVVAVVLCLALPILARAVRQPWFWIAGLTWLTILASVLAKLVFGVDAAWPTVLGFNFSYALAAMLVYWVIAGRRANAATRW